MDMESKLKRYKVFSVFISLTVMFLINMYKKLLFNIIGLKYFDELKKNIKK